MATLPMNQPGAQPGGGKSFPQMVMLATSLFGGGGIAYLVFQVVRDEPDKAFKLLSSWGPGYLLAACIAFGVNRLLVKALDAQMQASDRGSAAVERVAVQMQSLAEATNAQALALQKTADKDDRDKQEMQLLIGVVNSKVDQTLDEQRRQNRALERIENALSINRRSDDQANRPEGSEST